MNKLESIKDIYAAFKGCGGECFRILIPIEDICRVLELQYSQENSIIVKILKEHVFVAFNPSSGKYAILTDLTGFEILRKYDKARKDALKRVDNHFLNSENILEGGNQ